MSRPIPDEVIDRAVAMRRAGNTMKAIGAAFGRSNGWASIVVRRRLPKARDQRVPDQVRQTVEAMYLDGIEVREIADRFAKSTSFVYRLTEHLPRRARPTPEQLDRVVAEFKDGKTVEAAARIAGCSVYPARKHLFAVGLIETMHRPVAAVGPCTMAAILERKRAGLLPIEIARVLKLPFSQVIEAYNAAGDVNGTAASATLSNDHAMPWVQAGDGDHWQARLDTQPSDGETWLGMVEPRGGLLDSLVAAGPDATLTGADRFHPGSGPWLWAIGIRDNSGAFLLGGCGDAQSKEEAIDEAEGLVHRMERSAKSDR